MKKKAAVTLAAGVIALSGCAAPHKDHGMMTRATCATSPCPLTVKVADCGRIRTNPQYLEIPPGNTNDIVWTLDAPANWTFTNKGVEFKSGHGGGFSSGGGAGSRTFRYHNNHSVPGDHKYNVNVTPDRGATVCTEDPTIVNK